MYKRQHSGHDKIFDIETLVKNIETLADSTGSIDKACELLKITRKQYDDAKALLGKTLVV